MKKVLYGSTALVAAGALAATPAVAEEGVKLGISGYYNTFFWVGDVDEASGDPNDYGSTGLFADGEVHFKGSTTLDNGIKFGVQIELEAFQSGDQIDENYIFVEGSFGRMVIGGENTVGYMMQYAAPNVGTPLNSGWITVFVPPPKRTQVISELDPDTGLVVTTTETVASSTTGFRTPALSTYVDLANDDHALNYYSPRFSGFQVGASFVPAATVNGEGKNFPVQADENTEQHNMFAVGANFVESFGEVDIAVAGGFRHAEADKDSGDDDPQQISAGVNIGFAGFTIGGSFAVEDSDRDTNGWGADLGVSYSTGPWSVGVTAFHSEVDGTGNSEDELDALQGGVSYAIGPGITGSFSVMYAKWEPGNGDDADGVGGILGLKIGF